MRAWLLGLALSLLPLLTGCAGGRAFAVPYEPVTRAGVISVWVHHLEDFGDRFDVKLNMRNESAGTLIVRADDLRMFRGDTQCQVKAGRFNIGEEMILGARIFDIKPGETRTAGITGQLPTVVTGPFRVIVAEVWSNPTADGRAMGEIVARDLEWKYATPR